MNFILAWLLISLGLMIGDPEPIDAAALNSPNSIIQVIEVSPNSPAFAMGLQPGDVILKNQVDSNDQNIIFKNTEDVQNFISSQKGKEITFKIQRGNQIISTHGMPRVDAPVGQGALGISFQDSVYVKYPWYEALWKGARYTGDFMVFIVVSLGGILKNLIFGHAVGVEVSGPIGIAVLTKQATQMGLIYVLHLAAILSINLGIINILPIPALDGGRILFVIIEKIKRHPVSQSVEQAFHTVFFMLLILLMILVTFRDVVKFVK
jgi:regulator of sigma E protease